MRSGRSGLDPIERFLQEHASVGETESQGSFTIAADKALSKMASFQLPRPSAWLLKMVQAGVAAGCQRIAIQQNRKSTKVELWGGELGPLTTLLPSFVQAQALVSPAQQHLLIGLRSVALGHGRPVLVVEEPESGPTLTAMWNRARITEPTPGRSARRDLACLSFHVGAAPLSQRGVIPRARGLDPVLAEEYRDLVSHTTTCPIPLTLDGRRLDHFGLRGASVYRSPIMFGAAPVEGREPGFAIGSLALSLGDQLRWLNPQEKPTPPDPRATYHAAWSIFLGTQPTTSEVCWVKDGVVCQTQSLRHTHRLFTGRFFLSAQDLETDLTGLQVAFDPPHEAERRVQKAMEALNQSKLVLSEFRKVPFRYRLGRGNSGTWWLFAALLGTGIVAAPLATGAALGAGLTGLLGMVGTQQKDQRAYEGAIEAELNRWARAVATERRA